ncbi:MAG: RNA polymerase subunit sigma-24 [Pseudomonadota bacterium]|nr:RNA polymerase subunit sigma-24 [Pseudomonadota bacterium]
MNDIVTAIYRQESRRVFSTLVRLLGSFDQAEDALHDAFVAAAEQWPTQGVPANPVAWLVSTGRFKAIDRIRRDRRFVAWDEAAEQVDAVADDAATWDRQRDEREAIEDDRLRLVFTCCHPGLAEEARIALTLREVCGLTTEAIASALLIATPTLAQRIVRAKAKIAAARIPYEVPEPAERPARLASVLRVVYLVFNEGHSTQAAGLADEAIRLARLLAALLPEPEVIGLLALLLLHDARRDARLGASGEFVPLDEQDRCRWNHAAIAEGSALAEAALSRHGFAAYALQAAIAALHGEAPSAAATDWPQIVGLYDALLRIEPSPVIALNRAVAVAMRDGPEAGLALIEPLLVALPGYHAAAAAAADLCRRAGRLEEARAHYGAAASLARQEPERRFLWRRLAEVGG